jgi:pimeloyl-ACP methyl ester carboxylesterase
MMPFSVLRIWGLGIFSWLILGAAAYLLYEYADGVSPPPRLTASETGEPLPDAEAETGTDDPGRARVVAPVEIDAAERDTQGGWPYLAGGLALLAFSFGGFLPVLPFLGKPKLDEPQPDRRGRVITIDRPDGTRLHVESYGPESGPTVVFTHGWSLDSTAWYYVKRQFGERFRLVVWDLPGLGKSKGPRTNDYRIEKMAEDLNAVVSRISANGPVVLVGHSIGGMITQTFCRLHAEQLRTRVAGIVLLHTTYTNPLRTAWLAGLWSAIERPVIVPLNHLTVMLAPLAWLSNWQSYFNGTLHIFTRFASFAGDQTLGQVNYGARLAAKSWPGVVARGNLAMLEFDEQRTLPSIDVPTLVVGGEHDRMTTRQASDRIDQLAGHSMESTIDAGHLGFWEKNERFAELLASFVQRVQQLARDQESSTDAALEQRRSAPSS